ncbi:MAG TPA: IclR family transcriptional regulator [Pseudonocardiaceae bacterium]
MTSKVAAILMTFSGGSEHSLTEIARLAGLPTSTAHRLVCELAARRILERTENGSYRTGLSLGIIGSQAHVTPSVAERAPAVMEDLSAGARADVRLGVLHHLEVAYIEKQVGHRPVTTFTPAATLPLHATALGKALLAFVSPRIVDLVTATGLRAYTPYTITTPDRLRRALAVIRLTRVAVSRWELKLGVSAVAMPVFGPGGTVVAALEMQLRDLRNDFQNIKAALLVASRSLSRELANGLLNGYPMPLPHTGGRSPDWPAELAHST